MRMTDEKTKQEFKTYIGQFMGSQQKNTGTKKDGTPWTSHDILFHHGDMTKPIRFTWFAPTVEYVPQQMYRVVYVVDSFTVDGEARTAKKAMKVEPSTETTNLGYQDQQQQQPAIAPTPTTTTQQQLQPQQAMDVDEYLKLYKEKIDKERQTKYHFLTSYLAMSMPQLKPKFKEVMDKFEGTQQQAPAEQPKVTVEDV